MTRRFAQFAISEGAQQLCADINHLLSSRELSRLDALQGLSLVIASLLRHDLPIMPELVEDVLANLRRSSQGETLQ